MEHIVFALPVLLSVCFSVCLQKALTLTITVEVIKLTYFTCICRHPYGMTFSLVPRSKSAAKVNIKYQGHFFY